MSPESHFAAGFPNHRSAPSRATVPGRVCTACRCTAPGLERRPAAALRDECRARYCPAGRPHPPLASCSLSDPPIRAVMPAFSPTAARRVFIPGRTHGTHQVTSPPPRHTSGASARWHVGLVADLCDCLRRRGTPARPCEREDREDRCRHGGPPGREDERRDGTSGALQNRRDGVTRSRFPRSGTRGPSLDGTRSGDRCRARAIPPGPCRSR